MDGVYEERDGVLYATDLSRGPWDPGAQHGGAPAAVIMRAFEQMPTDAPELAIARVTFELLRPVPLGELQIETSVLRPGRRVQLLDASLRTPDGVEVVRARALRVARAAVASDVGVSSDRLPPPCPARSSGEPFRRSELRLFPTDAMDIRFVRGSFYEPGPSVVWFRLIVPIVAGETPSGLQRLAAAADFPNGIATELDWAEWIFINPDLSLFIEREPESEWICLDASMRAISGGGSLAEAVIYDERGRVGRSVQTLYVAPRGR